MAIVLNNSTTFESKAGAASLAVPIPTGGFPAGSLVVITLGAAANSTTSATGFTATDPYNGTYNVDSSYYTLNDFASFIISKYITTALAATDSITINTGSSTAIAGEILCFTGTAATSLDQQASLTASGTASPSVATGVAWTVGPTAALASSDELAVGLLSFKSAFGDTINQPTGWTAAGGNGTSGASGGSNRSTYAGYIEQLSNTGVTYSPVDASGAHNGNSMVATYAITSAGAATLSITTSDTSTSSETIALSISAASIANPTITVTDASTTSDSASLNVTISLSVQDSSITGDSVQLTSSTTINTADTATTSETLHVNFVIPDININFSLGNMGSYTGVVIR